MCNCINEMEEKMKELIDAESVEAPVELLTGKAYLEFTVKKKARKKRKKCRYCCNSVRFAASRMIVNTEREDRRWIGIMTWTVAGCGNTPNAQDEQDGIMEVVEST